MKKTLLSPLNFYFLSHLNLFRLISHMLDHHCLSSIKASLFHSMLETQLVLQIFSTGQPRPRLPSRTYQLSHTYRSVRQLTCAHSTRLLVHLVGNLGGGDGDRLLSGPNFLLAKLAVLKHLTQ